MKSYHTQIKKEHTDFYGHMNHAKYLEIFEDARWNLVTSKGISMDEVRKNQQGPVILEVSIKYHAELVLDDEVTINSWVKPFQGKTSWIEQCMKKTENDRIAAEVRVLYAIMDLKKRKIITPPKFWLKAFEG